MRLTQSHHQHNTERRTFGPPQWKPVCFALDHICCRRCRVRSPYQPSYAAPSPTFSPRHQNTSEKGYTLAKQKSQKDMGVTFSKDSPSVTSKTSIAPGGMRRSEVQKEALTVRTVENFAVEGRAFYRRRLCNKWDLTRGTSPAQLCPVWGGQPV